MKPQVELIYDSDCPNVEKARSLLLRAFAEAKLDPTWSEFDRQALDNPPHVKSYGSPTILINGKDVAEAADNRAACCRLYLDRGEISAVPTLAEVVAALKQAGMKTGFRWRDLVASVPSLVALLPVLHCPACWPAYAGLLSALGLSFLSKATYLLPITGALLVVALFSLVYRARTRHGYGPFLLGSVAVTAIVLGKFFFLLDPAIYAGLIILFVAFVWNALPQKEAYYAKD